MNACQLLHTFIHSFFFSVDMVHPNLNNDRLWQFNDNYVNMSFDISRSLVEGNKNQRGQHASAKVLNSLFSAIMGSVNP